MQQGGMDPLLLTPLSSDSVSPRSVPEKRRFGDLRGLQWRINLGVLPSSVTASIDVLRRVTADCRRRYANLRRRLLVEAPIPKNGTSSPNLVMDNPLSQNPDSTWSRFFRNAELEKLVDHDLSRLYPEHGSYFQTPGCQGILRRILLLWCLKHPECGYRQGMHELLAPLLCVLQVDLERLSEVRKLYDDHFIDRFDSLLCQENDLTYNFDFRRSIDTMEDEINSHGSAMKVNSLDELEPEIQSIVLLTDAYGAEGELGIVLSEKFLEHDAYCMFDALMKGANGSVGMANFFTSSPVPDSHTGLPHVIEASMALYHLLSLVDTSLHNHLLDLGVEPQYFYLRWLRVLYGREFSLDKLLIVWDEIFASDNSKMENSADDNIGYDFRILHSPRGAFILAFGVAMLLHLRSSLLATENPTTCLQRLLNFPENINIEKLIEKTKSLLDLALSVDILSSSHLLVGSHYQSTKAYTRSATLPTEPVSPKTPLNFIPDSYWEEKWRVAQKAEERKQDNVKNQVPTRKKGWTEKMKLRLKRTESDPPPSRIQSGQRGPKASFRRSLLEDLRKALGAEENTEHEQCHDEILNEQGNISEAVEVERQDSCCNSDNNYSFVDKCPSGNSGHDDDSSVFSDSTNLPNEFNDHEIASEKNSATSYLSLDEYNETQDTGPIDLPLTLYDPPENVPATSVCNNNDQENHQCNETSDISPNVSPFTISVPRSLPQTSERNNDAAATHPKESKQNKFLWFWKFGRNTVEVISEKVEGAAEGMKSSNSSNNQSNLSPSPASPAGNGHEQRHDEILRKQDNISEAVEVERQDSGCNSDNNYSSDDKCPSGNSGCDEGSSVFSDTASPPNEVNDHEIPSEKNSASSYSSLDEYNETQDSSPIDSPLPIFDPPENVPAASVCNNNDQENHLCNETSDISPNDSPVPISDPPKIVPATSVCINKDQENHQCNETSDISPNDSPVPISDPQSLPQTTERNNEAARSSATHPKESKQNKFQWFWKFGRNTVEVISEKVGGAAEATKSSNSSSNQSNSSLSPASPAVNGHCNSVSRKGDPVDQNVMGTLKNIGQSMLDHIQVIESVFQQDRGQGASSENLSKNALVGKGQVTAMTALKELWKISNLLSEM